MIRDGARGSVSIIIRKKKYVCVQLTTRIQMRMDIAAQHVTAKRIEKESLIPGLWMRMTNSLKILIHHQKSVFLGIIIIIKNKIFRSGYVDVVD